MTERCVDPSCRDCRAILRLAALQLQPLLARMHDGWDHRPGARPDSCCCCELYRATERAVREAQL